MLDKARQGALSEYARATNITLPAFVELVRGQTASDYRPNKALMPSSIISACGGYKHLDAVIRIAEEGVRVPMANTISRSNRPLQNHMSARERLHILRKNVRQEQDAGRAIVVDMDLLDQWPPEIIISQYGVIDKAGTDPMSSGRTIQNLSFPLGQSVNEATDKSAIPPPEYKPVEDVACKILRLCLLYPDALIFLLAGDVALAFRHVHVHSTSVYLFGDVIPEDNALVIDLACPFRWTGSPSYYELGSASSYPHGQTLSGGGSKPFFSYHWVDDHVLVAAGSPARRDECERSLRSAMVSILGPRAINETKFPDWETRLKVLGLLFDTVAMIVAMPPLKVEKAKWLVRVAYHAVSLTSTAFRSLLGSLRHVATCIRPARPFLQRLRQVERGLQFRRTVLVTEPMRLDLAWWWPILHSRRLNGVPMSYFRNLPDPDVLST